MSSFSRLRAREKEKINRETTIAGLKPTERSLRSSVNRFLPSVVSLFSRARDRRQREDEDIKVEHREDVRENQSWDSPRPYKSSRTSGESKVMIG